MNSWIAENGAECGTEHKMEQNVVEQITRPFFSFFKQDDDFYKYLTGG